MLKCKKIVTYSAVKYTGDNESELIKFGDGDIKKVKKKGLGYKAEDYYVLEYEEPTPPFSYDEPRRTRIEKGNYCVYDNDRIKVYTEKEFSSIFQIVDDDTDDENE